MSERIYRARLRSSSIATTVSISLMLFMLGLAAFIVLNAKKISDYLKENITISIYLKDDARESDILHLKKNLDAMDFVRESAYTSKEEAKQIYLREIDPQEDFNLLEGFNPLPASIDIKLQADHANNDSIEKIEKKLLEENAFIDEIRYEKALVTQLNELLVQQFHENVNKITLVVLLISALLLVIGLTLINNTIRLAIYSKRFLIKTMQLVGATQAFISKPYLIQSLLQGIIGALIANLLLMAVIYFLHRQVADLQKLSDTYQILYLLGAVVLAGVFITLVSTFFAVRKYLHLSADELY